MASSFKPEPQATALGADEILRLQQALERRDRVSVRKWFDRLAAQPVPGAGKWLARTAVVSGEFERGFAELRRLQGEGRLELEDALLLLRTAAILEREIEEEAVFARVDFTTGSALSARDRATLLTAANHIFERGNRAVAAHIFLALRAAGVADEEVGRTRLGEALLAARMYPEAWQILAAADDRGELSDYGLVALADAAMHLGDQTRADAAFDRLRAMRHTSTYFFERYIDHLLATDRATAARKVLDEIDGEVPEGVVRRLGAVVALHGTDIAAVAGVFDGLPADIARSLGDRVAGFGYRVIGSADEAQLQALTGLTERLMRDSATPGLAQFRIDLAFRQQNYEAAAAAIDTAASLLGPERGQLLTLKTAELKAFLGKIDEALATIDRIGAFADLPSSLISPVVTILAEARQSRKILAMSRIRLEEWFRYDSHASSLLAAAGAEDMWEELIEAIEQSLARNDSLEVRKLRAVAMERVAGADRLSVMLEDQDVTSISDYRVRLVARSEALNIAPGPNVMRSVYERDDAVLYCTDTGYLAPAFNSINSLLMSNGGLRDNLAIYLFVSDEDVELSEQIAAALRVRYKCSLTIMPASRLLESYSGTLRTDYGLFTGGMQLSQSAYHRIFALRYLLENDAKRRALYIDSDTLVTGEISRIFSVLDGAHALFARREVDKMEVRRVERLHDLRRGEYFNSGVLCVDMTHPDLARHLNETIEQVANHADRLVYHDQCALNLGFREASGALPIAFNSFVTPREDMLSPPIGGVILHFLDRPKPWQPGYRGPVSAFWYRYWAELGKVVDADLLAQLIARSPI